MAQDQSARPQASGQTSPSHAERRARQSFDDRKFIPPLHWSGAKLLPAVALVIPQDTAFDWIAAHRRQLGELRDGVSEIFRYGGLPGPHDLIVLRFAGDVEFHADALGSFIPLQWMSSGALTNLDSAVPLRGAQPTPGGVPVEIYWRGERRNLLAERARQLDKFLLWEMPTFELHEARQLPLKRVAQQQVGPARSATSTETLSSRSADLFKEPADIFTGLEKRIDQAQYKRQWRDFLKPSELLGRLFTSRSIGTSSSGVRGGSQGGQPRYSGPSWGTKMRGWLAWHTPLGSAVRHKYSQRLNQVSDMIKRGDVDGALKYALATATKHRDKEKRKNRSLFPTDVPPPRASLDLEITLDEVASPILGDMLHDEIIEDYYNLARQLSDAGDHARAAFVYAKLLGAYDEAVHELEKGDLYADAAKLALQAKLDPAEIIRLFFLAGDHRRALALAARFDCFAGLADYARKSHPHFYAFVIKAWSEQLAASEQWLSALRVSDALAKTGLSQDDKTHLHDRRRDWLNAALADAQAPGCELISYGLVYLLWRQGEVTITWSRGKWSAAGPDAANVDTVSKDTAGKGKVIAQLANWMHEDSEMSTRRLDDVVQQLTTLGDNTRGDQTTFWRHASGPIVDVLIRQLIARQTCGLSRPLQHRLKKLTELARLDVLSEDMKKLAKLTTKSAAKGPLVYDVALHGPVRPVAKVGSCLHNGWLLLWRTSKLLELIDETGTVRWSTPLNSLSAIIQMGSSPYAILVQDIETGGEGGVCRRRLVRFDCRSFRLSEIGVVDLRAWHDVTSESQWMVQIGSTVGSLDLGKLLVSTAPQIEFVWRAQVAIDLQCLAFYMCPGDYFNWITIDRSATGEGLIEYWCYGTPTNSIDVRSYIFDDAELVANDWLWLQNYHLVDPFQINQPLTGYWGEGDRKTMVEMADKMKQVAQRRPHWAPKIISCDMARVGLSFQVQKAPTPQAGSSVSSNTTIDLRHVNHQPLVTLKLAENLSLTVLARSSGEQGQVLFSLPNGAVLVVDIAARDIRLI